MRKTFAVQQQAKSAFETYQVAFRCGLHWKSWAHRRAMLRIKNKPVQKRETTLPASFTKGDNSIKKSEDVASNNTTPRFPVSLFNTPRELPNSVPAFWVDTQPPAPVKIAASPVRPTSQGRGLSRARPRQPDFLVASLKRAGLIVEDTTGVEAQHSSHTAGSQIPKVEPQPPDFIIDPSEIERLNLTMLTSVASESDSARSLTPRVVPSSKGDLNAKEVDYNHASLHGDWKQKSSADTRCVVSGFSSALSECGSTPRIVCENSLHSHPFSETKSFQISDFQEQVTPRSHASGFTPREQLSSLGFDSHITQSKQLTQSINVAKSDLSTESIQKEIVTIRNKLKAFDQKRKKLRTMQKQLKQLTAWLKEMEGQGSDDDDVISARQEVKKLTADIDVLKKSVEQEKTTCSALVDRVKQLTSQLSVS